MPPLTAKVRVNDKWNEIHCWLSNTIGPCGAKWFYDSHWTWVKIVFVNEEDWTLFCLTWK